MKHDLMYSYSMQTYIPCFMSYRAHNYVLLALVNLLTINRILGLLWAVPRVLVL